MIDLIATSRMLTPTDQTAGALPSNLNAVGAVLSRVRTNLSRPDHPQTKSQERYDPEAALHLATIAMAEAEARIKRQQRRIEHLEGLSVTDELTGLVNRRGFRNHLAKAVAHARRQSNSGLLVVIDLDQFKAINDAHGHLAGDAMLIAVAKVLNAFVRETDTVARLGGDEFAILMPSADLLEGQKRINFLEAQLNSKTVQHGQAQLQIKASVGCQTYQGYETEDALLNAADKVMYTKKAQRQSGPAPR
jgi:diguanylate cyclase (GGDEF)-like protein